MNKKGLKLSELRKYEKAIEDATKAIDLDPNQPNNYNIRGEVYYELNEFEKAIEDASKLIDLDPNEPHNYNLRGKAYCELKEFEKAIKDANKAINLKSDEPRFYQLRADAKQKLNFEEKKYTIDQYIVDNLEDIKNYLNEADRYYEESRIIEAIDYYEKVLSKSNSEIKEILGNGVMIRINNRILEYRKMINS